MNETNDQYQKLEEAVNQLRYIESHKDEIAEKDDFDKEVEKIQQLNNVLISALADSLDLSKRTINRHKNRLQTFLNEDISYQISTIFGAKALDLEQAMSIGFSFSELKETKTALKKLFDFLHDEKLLNDDEWEDMKEQLSKQLQNGDEILSEIGRDNDLDELDDLNWLYGDISDEEDKKFTSYCESFANLYGVISCDQAFRLMRRLEPEFEIDKFNLMDWFDDHYQETNANFIVKEITGTAMIVVNDIATQELEENLLAAQLGKPFYIPKKDELLKYQSSQYYEESAQTRAYEKVLKNSLDVPVNLVHRLTSQTIRMINNDFWIKMGESIKNVQTYLEHKGYSIRTEDDFENWINAFMNLNNSSHLWSNRGWQPGKLRYQPNAGDFFTYPHRFTDEIKNLLENYELDPMDIIVGMPDDLSQAEQSKILRALDKLNIESLGDES